MLYRIDENGFHIESFNSSYPYFKEEWILVEVEIPSDFLKPKWNGSQWIETATSEEIQAHQYEQQMLQYKEFISLNKEAGRNFYDDINLRVTISLFAVERSVLFPILQEVDALLYPPLNKIKTGDFASALFIFTNQTPPTNQFVLNFYNEAVSVCQNYYDTKYPK